MDDLEKQIGFGAFPSEKDYRDHKDPDLALGLPFPSEYHTDVNMLEVTHQKKLGICTSNLAYYVEWLYFKKTGNYVRLSRRFLYSITKNLIDQNNIEGSSLRSPLKAAYNYGICKEETFPSDTEGFTHEQYIDINAIPPAAWAEAKSFKAGGYISIPATKEGLMQALYKYGLLYSMMHVGKEWWTGLDGVSSWDKSKIDPLRPPAVVVSGHAVVHTAYDPIMLELRNSWSKAWDCEGNAHHEHARYMPLESWAVTLDKVANDLPAETDFHHAFTIPMKQGDLGPEVKALQIALMITGDMDFVQPVDRGFYGPKTTAAVFRYQLRKKLPLSWTEKTVYKGKYCGPKTIAVLTENFK